MILTVRIQKQEEKQLAAYASKHNLNRTSALKQLLHQGFVSTQLNEYKSGNISLGKLAENLDIPVTESLNLIAHYNAHPRMPGDYLEYARENAKKLGNKNVKPGQHRRRVEEWKSGKSAIPNPQFLLNGGTVMRGTSREEAVN